MHLDLKSFFGNVVPATRRAPALAPVPASAPVQAEATSPPSCTCGYEAAFEVAALAGALPEEARSYAASHASATAQCRHTHR